MSRANFLAGFGGTRLLGVCVVTTPIFLPKVVQKIKNESKHQNLYFSSLINSFESSFKNLLPNRPKNGWVMVNIRMPIAQIWACAPYLGHNLAKYQYFWMKPTLFELYQLITYCLWCIARFLLNCFIYGQKPLKIDKIDHISTFAILCQCALLIWVIK